MSENIKITDEYLYANMPRIEARYLSTIPPDSEITHEFSRRFERKMNKLLKRERRTPIVKRFIAYGQRAAVIVLVASTVTFCTTISVEALHTRFFEFVRTVYDSYISILIETDDPVSDTSLIPIEPPYVPSGYTEFERYEDEHELVIRYANENDSHIKYNQLLLTTGQIIIDNENVDTESISIGNQNIDIYYKNNTYTLYWTTRDTLFMIVANADKTELLTMAEKIIEKK